MFKDRVALIAGATGNLGQSVVNVFAKGGASLALFDRSAERLKDSFPELAGREDCLFVECSDVSDPAIFGASLNQALEKFGQVDIFVTLVGGFKSGSPLHETPLATLDFMLNLNVRTLYVAAQAVIPGMRVRGYGKIIAVGARPGLMGTKNSAAYSAAKSGVIRLVESMGAELKTDGINVNCVVPGTMDTPQNRADTPNADFTRWLSTGSVADVIGFLASDAARDIHGAAVPVYGRT